MSALSSLLEIYRQAPSEREKGTYFEQLIICYLKNEATYRDLYCDVWTYGEWASLAGLSKQDAGIDLVAKTRGTEELHAIQCKLYDENYRLQKSDIDSFFTASGKKYFSYRIIVATTNHWSEHAEDALQDQQPPVAKIDLHDLENSQIDWSSYKPNTAPALKPKKSPRPHQIDALAAVEKGFSEAERGKLIMACGTGKTFTSLKIAETIAGKGKRVLFLVPSLSLLSQTLTEWTQESALPLHSFAVCSDSDVGKQRSKNINENDSVQLIAHELRYPATTDSAKLASAVSKRHDDEHMTVVYSTYHSIDVIHRAQQHFDLPAFDLIICDESHRTTGAIIGGDEPDESAFVKVHNNNIIQGAKRLYMTATPRIYADSAKASAELNSVALCSMDDESLYGKEFFTITFSDAVKRGLLVDYKVIILSVDEDHINRRLQNLLSDENNQLKVDDAAKIVGCWKALAKQGISEDLNGDSAPMKRAVAFCQVIDPPAKARTHKVSSRNIANIFQDVVEAYQAQEDIEPEAHLACEAQHVDGGMNASEKEAKIDWLKAATDDGICRILSNVRCLSEGVDVPALDAVLFLTPRNSQIDVVQSVGRVMRNSPGKRLGYVILPVVIPAGVDPNKALDDNKTYAVVWQVLQALRSHDDRFDAMVNKLDLIGKDTRKMEVIAISDKLPAKQAKALSTSKRNGGKGSYKLGEDAPRDPLENQTVIQFEVGDIERAIYAKLVQKVGNRHHWEDWATDIAKIAQTHISRIKTIIENEDNQVERQAFDAFAKALKADLNDSLSDEEIIEMLAQHIITKPVFDALFDKYSFAQHNPMSLAMQQVLDVLEAHRLEKEADTLQAFYASVKMRAEGIDNAAGKQRIIVELYDKFFRNAFPKMTERLGIVYTPVEVVDFIIHSVDQLLRQEFGQSLASEGVHILDPFTGTGTFITRLLQSGLIPEADLPRKYASEIHANELVLLAYYIAAINIETTFHGLVGGDYKPFDGICLTDTFQDHEEDLAGGWLAANNKRRKRQDQLDIRVIIGNPPYSVGQDKANDNNQNVAYPKLDARIAETYVAGTNATLRNALYDSYIRAIRWASDRVGNSGIIGFVTNAGFLDASAADGLRKCLAEEFSSLYVFHLRGNQRTSGELSRKEGGKIFGGGSRAPIAISLLVKNPSAETRGRLFFHDIGDYLTREEKLNKIIEFRGIDGIREAGAWREIALDQHGDWLKQRDDNLLKYAIIGDKKNTSNTSIFTNYSNGVKTNRDAWCYNFSKITVEKNMKKAIDFYNSEVERFATAYGSLPKKQRDTKVEAFINTDPKKFSWDRPQKFGVSSRRLGVYDGSKVFASTYRPFMKAWLYYDRFFNNCIYQMPSIFPVTGEENLAICVTGVGSKSFSALIVDSLPCFDMIEKGQCFPLYIYDTKILYQNNSEEPCDVDEVEPDLFRFDEDLNFDEKPRKIGLSDAGFEAILESYQDKNITKKDVFYYIYGLLHSPEYRAQFSDNLAKELPRIPCVRTVVDFWAFSQAGRDLSKLHVEYDTAEPYNVTIDCGHHELTDSDYRVEKMRYGSSGKGRGKDLTTLHYNDKITLRGIPLEAYEYVVNGKPALDWVVERQCVKTDKDSGIVNDANDWAVETMHNPRYPLELFMRVITVSLETMKIVKALPPLEID
jgi:predicted helicase